MPSTIDPISGAIFTPEGEELPVPPDPVPARVSNLQARATMRNVPMPDGRSLFGTIDADLRAAIEATRELDEFDPARLQADLQWQAWEQANDYERYGSVTQLLAARYGFDSERTDTLFRQARDIRL